MAAIKVFERGVMVGDAVFVSVISPYRILFLRYSELGNVSIPDDYEFVGVVFNVNKGTAKILHKTAASMQYALDAYSDGMATSDWYRRKNGGTTNYRGIMNVARGVAYWGPNGSTPSSNIPIQYSGNDIINENAFLTSQYCADLRLKYSSYKAYIKDNMMVMLPQHEGCFALPDSLTLQNTYGDQTNDNGDYMYPAFQFCKQINHNYAGLGEGQWFLPNVWDGTELMRDDILAKVAATMSKCGGSAPNNSTNRWFAQRYTQIAAWSFYGSNGVLDGYYVTYELTVQAVALLDVT